MTDRVLILDFGSQVTQLIARRVRESGVYCEIHPFSMAPDRLAAFAPKAIILSGGPASVAEMGTPRAPQYVFEMGVPVLGICYGQMTTAAQLGVQVESGHDREFGRAFLEIRESCALFDGLWKQGERHQVWMSHGDRITAAPPGFRVAGISEGAPFAVIADDKRKFYGLMFHPEVAHTPDGAALLKNFTHRVAGLSGDWSMAAFRAQEIARIRQQVGKSRVICGLSGGVDSSITACCGRVKPRKSSNCSAATTTFRWCIATRAICSLASSPESKTPNRNARSSAPPLSTCSTRKRKNSAGPIFWHRARSIPTSLSR